METRLYIKRRIITWLVEERKGLVVPIGLGILSIRDYSVWLTEKERKEEIASLSLWLAYKREKNS